MFQAKLYMPCIGNSIVRRKKIEEKLRLLPDYKLAFLSAPVGYGKTTAVADYLTRERIKHAWFSIDEADNNPVSFWRYLTAAIARCLENSDVTGISIDAKLIASNISADLLIHVLEDIHEEFVIVLDDYHLIENSTILSSVEYFVKYLPRNIKPVILSRKEPENMLSLLCSRGVAIRLGAPDISFDPEETAEFFSQKGLYLTGEELEIMGKFTEGWAAGLVAASFAIQTSVDRDQAIRAFSGLNRDVSTILEYEVFRRWTEKIRVFLIHTSFLERLSGSLCTAVTGHEGSTALLKLLAESNSFIVSLNTEKDCYRYHHLFQKFLADRFEQESEEIKRLHYGRAGEWYLAHGQVADGIHWLIKAGEYERALPLIMDRWFDMTRDSEFLLWKQWIDVLPETVYENRNTVFTAYSWILSMENQVEEAEIWTGKARACFERNKNRLGKEERDYLEAHVLFAEVNIAFWKIDTAKLLNRMHFLGKMNLNTRVVLGEMNWDEPNLLKTAYGFRGNLSRIEECLPLMDGLDLLIGNYAAYFAVIIAEFYYERNCLNELDAMLAKYMTLIIGINFPGVIVPCFLVYAKGKVAKGDIAGAFEMIREARKLLGEKRGNVWHYYLDIFTASLYLRIGDAVSALKLIDTEKLGPYDALSANRESEYIVYARYLLLKNRLEEALILLNRLENFARQENRLGSRMELLCLTALCYGKTGNYGSAVQTLEKALSMGVTEGYVRTFVDEAGSMADLLSRYGVMSRGDKTLKHAVYAKKLLRLTNEYVGVISSAVPNDGRTLPGGEFRISLLGKRELQVVQLLAQSKTNAEIADALMVSVSMIKQHNSNIFDKLGVKNRVEATVRARTLGLIE